MRRSLSTLILSVTVLVLPLLSEALAQESATHEIVGFSFPVGGGNRGVLDWTADCQSEYGSDARMCNSVEVMRSTSLPGGTPVDGWVRPVLRGDGASVYDASGVTAGTEGLSCNGWTTGNPVFRGLSVDKKGWFRQITCDQILGAACCVPIPTPVMAAVPSMLWLGRGLLVAFMLSAAGAVYLFRSRPRLSSGRGDPLPRG